MDRRGPVRLHDLGRPTAARRRSPTSAPSASPSRASPTATATPARSPIPRGARPRLRSRATSPGRPSTGTAHPSHPTSPRRAPSATAGASFTVKWSTETGATTDPGYGGTAATDTAGSARFGPPAFFSLAATIFRHTRPCGHGRSRTTVPPASSRSASRSKLLLRARRGRPQGRRPKVSGGGGRKRHRLDAVSPRGEPPVLPRGPPSDIFRPRGEATCLSPRPAARASGGRLGCGGSCLRRLPGRRRWTCSCSGAG